MRPVGLTVTVDAPMPEARDRILGRVDHRLRSAGLTRREKNGAIDYRRNSSASSLSGRSAVFKMNT